jgi:spore maturation protein CgeB
MRVALFCHSILSDWNHGNAHFLRGVVTELVAQGFPVKVYEPHNAWSLTHLLTERGEKEIERVRFAYPALDVVRFDPEHPELERALEGVGLVIVHEWNDPALVHAIGQIRAQRKFVLLFHDTHHRSVSAPQDLGRYDLSKYDGVLAFGEVIRRQYLAHRWAKRAFIWHEAADTRVFRPLTDANPNCEREGEVVWIGNWGDDERNEEIREFLIDPVRRLGARALVHGVRYPKEALDELARAGMRYRGFLPNFDVPLTFAKYQVTVHIPRRYYVRALPGIPTIRPFEALACGIALVSAPWEDREGLFRPGHDFLVARDGAEMTEHLRRLLHDPDEARALAAQGLATVLDRHTCAHRVRELLRIAADLGATLGTRGAAGRAMMEA